MYVSLAFCPVPLLPTERLSFTCFCGGTKHSGQAINYSWANRPTELSEEGYGNSGRLSQAWFRCMSWEDRVEVIGTHVSFIPENYINNLSETNGLRILSHRPYSTDYSPSPVLSTSLRLTACSLKGFSSLSKCSGVFPRRGSDPHRPG